MFATANVNCYKGVTRKTIYSLMTRIDKSVNPIFQTIAISEIHCASNLRIQWIASMCNKKTVLFIYLFSMDIMVIV